MSQKKCCICDGDIVDGRCIQCGMPSYDDGNKYHLNEDLTFHRQNCETPKQRKAESGSTESYEYMKSQKQSGKKKQQTGHTEIPYTRTTNAPTPGLKKNVVLSWGVIIAIVTFIFIGMQEENNDRLSVDLDSFFDSSEEIQESADWSEEDYYAYVTRQLSDSGTSFEEELDPGVYQVGNQIPEGTYTVLAGELTDVSFNVFDNENSIYRWESLTSEESNYSKPSVEDIRLYSGAIVEIIGYGNVTFKTANAQDTAMASPTANPLTETVSVSGEEAFTMEAGKDFPAGNYDIVYKSGDGSVAFFEDSSQRSALFLSFSDSMYGTKLMRNVYFPEGDKFVFSGVYSDALSFELVPSETCYEWNMENL